MTGKGTELGYGEVGSKAWTGGVEWPWWPPVQASGGDWERHWATQRDKSLDRGWRVAQVAPCPGWKGALGLGFEDCRPANCKNYLQNNCKTPAKNAATCKTKCKNFTHIIKACPVRVFMLRRLHAS